MPGHDNTGEWAYRYAINFYLLLAEIPVSDDLQDLLAHLQSSVFKLSKDLIDSIHEEGIVAYTS